MQEYATQDIYNVVKCKYIYICNSLQTVTYAMH